MKTETSVLLVILAFAVCCGEDMFDARLRVRNLRWRIKALRRDYRIQHNRTAAADGWMNRSIESYKSGLATLSKEISDLKRELNRIVKDTGTEYTPQDIPALPQNCRDAQQTGYTLSGALTIQPKDSLPFSVYCDMETEGGGWTVIQRRLNGRVDFNRPWTAYEGGFGRVYGEYWLGLEKLTHLTQSRYKNVQLRIELSAFDNTTAVATYSHVRVVGSENDYALSIGSYSGMAGDALRYHDGRPFSTYDRENDIDEDNCAEKFGGGWWYGGCHSANLNGPFVSSGITHKGFGIVWFDFKGFDESLSHVEMKIRHSAQSVTNAKG